MNKEYTKYDQILENHPYMGMYEIIRFPSK